METYGDVMGAFYPLIGDSESVGAFIGSAQAYSLASKAIRTLADESRCVDVVYGPYTWTAGNSTNVPFAASDYDILSLWRVEVDDEKVLPVTKGELRRSDRDWQQRTGKPYLYYLDELATSSGKTTIGLYPKPSSNESVRLYAAISAYQGNLSTEYIQLPKWAIPGVLFSMLADFYRMPGVRHNMSASKFYRALYDDVRARLVQESNARLPKDRVAGGTRKPSLAADRYRGDISTIS